jgi:putative membrane protein
MYATSWIQVGSRARLLLAIGVALAAGAPAPSTRAQQGGGDQAFLEQALGVNELELQLGKLATERGGAEVKAMGQKMVQKHTELGAQLSGLAKQAGSTGEAKLTPEQQATYDRIAKLSGSDFDAAFKKTVDDGHVKELAMYRDEASRASSPELRALAQQRVTTLEQSVKATAAAKESKKPQPKTGW